MRRYARTLILIAVLVIASALILGIQKIKIGNFERGGDTVLGLSLGLDLQGGKDLWYQAVDTETREPITPPEDQMKALERSIERRVNASGLGDPTIQRLGDDRLLIQLPGVRDPDRAKSIIGETAQLVFRHRTISVPRSLPEDITSADIVSVTIGAFPGDVEPSESTSVAEGTTETEAAQVEDPAEKQVPQAGATSESSGSQPEVASEQVQVEGKVEAATLQPAAPSEGEPPESAAATATSTPQAEGSAESQAESETQPIPHLIVEFTDEGAQKFTAVVARLRESIALDENLTPIESPPETIYPSSLTVSLEGTEKRSLQLSFGQPLGQFAEQFGAHPLMLLGPPFIRRIDGSNVFALNLRGVAANVEKAQEIFGDDLDVAFGPELQGKVDEDISLTGDDLDDAYPSQNSASGRPIVNLEFNERGTRIFGELTEQIVRIEQQTGRRDQIAIFLDGEELISPTVQTVITAGTAIIQGRDFTIQRVRDIALLLQEGSLPLTIELLQERDVDAILGADSLSKSIIAGLVGLALVFLFMILYYRIPGLVAAVALLIYASLLLSILKIVPVTLNLSGVAASILSIGMAVDANVLIFERMKDELRAGRTLMSAVNIGFSRAWPAIRDGNVSTLITCGILYWFSAQLGATIVQGFAVTLAIGVAVSMFSAITISRTMLRVLTTTGLTRRLGLFVPSGGPELAQQREATAPAPERS